MGAAVGVVLAASVVPAVVSVLSLVHVLFVVAVPPVHVNPSSFVQVEEQPSPI